MPLLAELYDHAEFHGTLADLADRCRASDLVDVLIELAEEYSWQSPCRVIRECRPGDRYDECDLYLPCGADAWQSVLTLRVRDDFCGFQVWRNGARIDEPKPEPSWTAYSPGWTAVV